MRFNTPPIFENKNGNKRVRVTAPYSLNGRKKCPNNANHDRIIVWRETFFFFCLFMKATLERFFAALWQNERVAIKLTLSASLWLFFCLLVEALFLLFQPYNHKKDHKITPCSPLSLPLLSLLPLRLHRPRCPLPRPRLHLSDPETCLCCSPFSTSSSCSETRSSPAARWGSGRGTPRFFSCASGKGWRGTPSPVRGFGSDCRFAFRSVFLGLG